MKMKRDSKFKALEDRNKALGIVPGLTWDEKQLTVLDKMAAALGPKPVDDLIHDSLMVRRSHLDTPVSAQTAQEFSHEHIRRMEKLRDVALRDITRQIQEERVCRAMAEALTPKPKPLGHDDMLDAFKYGMSWGHSIRRPDAFGVVSIDTHAA